MDIFRNYHNVLVIGDDFDGQYKSSEEIMKWYMETNMGRNDMAAIPLDLLHYIML